MPELPDITVYVAALRERILGRCLERVSIRGPFLLRSTAPPVAAVEARKLEQVRRVGNRIAIGM